MTSKTQSVTIDEAGRRTALDRTLAGIAKTFGEGAMMRLGDSPAANVESISTGSLGLDLAVGVGGLPRGRVVEIYGPEASGKTTLALHAVAEAQKTGGVAAYIDAEHALDPGRARTLGVNLEDLLVSQPASGEEALEIVNMLVASAAVDIVVVDSVAALVPKAELDGEMGEQKVGLQARLMSQAMRKLTATISRTRTCVVFINQIRMKIGVMFGSPETTPGGNALKFYSSVRLNIRRVSDVKCDGESVGSTARVKVVKNRVAAPFRQATFDILYTHGISRDAELLDLGVEHKVVDKLGAWLSYGETRLGQGREKAMATLKDNPDLAEAIRRDVIAAAADPDLADRLLGKETVPAAG